jgi:hypothetical protein
MLDAIHHVDLRELHRVQAGLERRHLGRFVTLQVVDAQ